MPLMKVTIIEMIVTIIEKHGVDINTCTKVRNITITYSNILTLILILIERATSNIRR